MLDSITTDNVALVTEAVDAIQSHVEALAGAPADARPQMLAAHKAHITMLMQRLRNAHPDLATVAPMRRKASENFPLAVVALREACASVRNAAQVATQTLGEALVATAAAQQPEAEDEGVEDANAPRDLVEAQRNTRRRRNRR